MNLAELGQTIGLSLQNEKLFLQAFTHTSFAHERKGERHQPDNERLEFLGDAVLELAVSEHLYHRFPHLKEGDLTRMRARIVCEPSLAFFAKELQFGKYVRLGKGEERTGGRNRPALLADVFEAFIGALFLEKGLDGVCKFMESAIFPRIDEQWLAQASDAKSRLQEAVQQEHLGLLEYQIVDVKGPAHDRQFVAEVWLAGEKIGRGTGRSKKEAEQRLLPKDSSAFKNKTMNGLNHRYPFDRWFFIGIERKISNAYKSVWMVEDGMRLRRKDVC